MPCMYAKSLHFQFRRKEGLFRSLQAFMAICVVILFMFLGDSAVICWAYLTTFWRVWYLGAVARFSKNFNKPSHVTLFHHSRKKITWTVNHLVSFGIGVIVQTYGGVQMASAKMKINVLCLKDLWRYVNIGVVDRYVIIVKLLHTVFGMQWEPRSLYLWYWTHTALVP